MKYYTLGVGKNTNVDIKKVCSKSFFNLDFGEYISFSFKYKSQVIEAEKELSELEVQLYKKGKPFNPLKA